MISNKNKIESYRQKAAAGIWSTCMYQEDPVFGSSISRGKNPPEKAKIACFILCFPLIFVCSFHIVQRRERASFCCRHNMIAFFVVTTDGGSIRNYQYVCVNEASFLSSLQDIVYTILFGPRGVKRAIR